ncbi:protein of unknown function [Bradyrhizobium vignae]|uniref:Uncharacterized protein n=1 Tax=Bradyrhizobium vignae TaxID=1549949 RepID=A0A2U3Q8F8_9BRAD|nr:protein of unknown function [Bradyrhizobium vignae]
MLQAGRINKPAQHSRVAARGYAPN